MKILSLLHDYRKAIGVATRAKSGNVPAGIASVLKARLMYDIGPRHHALYDLARTPEETWPEFIIDNKLKPLLRKINTESARHVVQDKHAFRMHCTQNGLATIPILAKIDRTSPDDPLDGADPCRWNALLADAPDELFVKLIDGTWGTDAFVAKRKTDTLWRYCDQNGSLTDLHAFAMSRLKARRGWIVQPVIHNHPDLTRIMSPNALGTVRAVTYLSGNDTELLYAVLRIPVGANLADNFAHGTSGNLVAPIDIPTGRIGMARVSKGTAWPDIIDISRHPDSGELIEGTHLPHWTAAIELVRAAQSTLPELPTLGWDIAFSDSGPLLVEANSTFDVDILQVAYKRGLRTDFLKNRIERILQLQQPISDTSARARR